MLIFIQRGTSVPFFLRFFRGFAPSCRTGHGERLLRQEAFGFAPTTTVAGEILASDAGVSRTYEDTLRVRPTGFLFEDPVCSISVLPQRQTVCRMTIFESVILSVSEILCKKLFLCFCCGQKERKTLPFSS